MHPIGPALELMHAHYTQDLTVTHWKNSSKVRDCHAALSFFSVAMSESVWQLLRRALFAGRCAEAKGMCQ